MSSEGIRTQKIPKNYIILKKFWAWNGHDIFFKRLSFKIINKQIFRKVILTTFYQAINYCYPGWKYYVGKWASLILKQFPQTQYNKKK